MTRKLTNGLMKQQKNKKISPTKLRQIYTSLEKLNFTLDKFTYIYRNNLEILSLLRDYRNLLKDYDYIIEEFKNE